MRKYFIDNIRILCILLLFPFHTSMIYIAYSDKWVWYIHGKSSTALTMISYATYPWWMALLFAIAGMSTVYALKHRTGVQYAKERFFKLLVPCVAALFFVVPVQSFIADRFYKGYTGTYLGHFVEFFKLTDWQGSDGHFTPGHVWFILFLFLYSMVALPLILWTKKRNYHLDGKKWTMPKLVCLFIPLLIVAPILDIGGKGMCEFFVCFLYGYFLLSLDEVQERLKKNAFWLGAAWVLLMITRCLMCVYPVEGSQAFEFALDVQYRIFCWIGILAVLGLGKRFLDFNSGFTRYFTPAIFPLYIFHQSVIVIVGYFLVDRISITFVEYLVIMVVSFVLTVVCYEACRRCIVTRVLFGIKKK